jgi:hypothetical protein
VEFTYTESHESREELDTSSLGDFLTARDAGQVDVSRLDDAGLALGGLDDALGESMIVSIRRGVRL